MKKINIIICLIFLIFIKIPANAASIGVKPERIELSVALGREITQEILIFNAGDEPGTYVLSLDEEIDAVKIEPKEFVLEAGAERLVKITIKNYFPKTISTNISVVSRPLRADGFSAGAGVKIPLQIHSYFSQVQIIIIAFCFALIIMILFKLFRVKKKKT